jgi:thioredoxin-related protein
MGVAFCLNKSTMQKLIPFFLSAWIVLFSCAQKPFESGEPIQWMSLTEATASLQHQKKPVLIDLYTDWCSWCRVMDKKTYSNKRVAEYVQEKFYPVRVNAESKDALTWKGKTYRFNENYRANDFAVYITQGKLAFPTTIIIPGDGSEPQAIPGYLETRDFELIAKYFGEGGYGKIPFDQYRRDFQASW